jgi:hypothetical protein
MSLSVTCVIFLVMSTPFSVIGTRSGTGGESDLAVVPSLAADIGDVLMNVTRDPSIEERRRLIRLKARRKWRHKKPQSRPANVSGVETGIGLNIKDHPVQLYRTPGDDEFTESNVWLNYTNVPAAETRWVRSLDCKRFRYFYCLRFMPSK